MNKAVRKDTPKAARKDTINMSKDTTNVLQTHSFTSSPEMARAFVVAAKLPDPPVNLTFSGLLKSHIGHLSNNVINYGFVDTGIGGNVLANVGMNIADAKVDDNDAATKPEPALNSNGELQVKAGLEQSWIVCNQIMSFDQGITNERRLAALHSALFAQLAADEAQSERETPAGARAWHAEYIHTLTRLGWVLQGGHIAQNSTSNIKGSFDKVLLSILETVLPGGTAIALATRVIDTLEKMKDNDPLITVFERRTVESQSVEFAMSLATGAGSDFLITVAECALSVTSDHTGVLFFKWDTDEAKLDYQSYDLSLDDVVYAAAKEDLERRLQDYVRSFVTEVKLAPPPM